jgi:hypothetical protein
MGPNEKLKLGKQKVEIITKLKAGRTGKRRRGRKMPYWDIYYHNWDIAL